VCADDLPTLTVSLTGKYYAVSAAAAALRYVTANHMRFAPHTVRIKYWGREGLLMATPLWMGGWMSGFGWMIDWLVRIHVA